MKNQASAKEERKKSNNIISHREFNLNCHSLWLIIFIGLLFFHSAYYYAGCVFSQRPQDKLLFTPFEIIAKSKTFPLLSCESKKGELFRTGPVRNKFSNGAGFTYGEIDRVSLDNEMVVLLKENHNLPLVSLFLCVLTGSAREGKFSGSGLSHFTEHMVFKGTAQRGVGDIFREIESYGGKINAFTSYDYTSYKVTVPSEFVFPALEILADIAMNATFDKQELEKEREVVLKEIRLSYDSAQRHASRLLWQTAFLIHPYKYAILGKEYLFKKLTREDLLAFYQEKYAPNNMILTVVGDVETDQTLTFIKNIFKDFPKKSIPNSENEPEPKQKDLRKREERFTSGLTYLLLGFHSVAITDEDCCALDVLGTILGGGESSRLYKLICSKKRLAYSVEAINYTPCEPGLFIISTLLEEAQRKHALSLILDQINLVKKKIVSERELESAKNKINSDVLFHNQTLAAQAQDLALNEAITGDFRFTEKYIQKIREVTSQDILRMANKYLQQDNLSIVALIPQNDARMNTLRSSDLHLRIGIENLTRETHQATCVNPALPKPSPCAAGELGKTRKSSIAKKSEEVLPLPKNTHKLSDERKGGVKRYILDNGLTLLVRENKELPLVSIKAVFKGGLRVEDQDNNGLCNLVAEMTDKGTRTKTAPEIAYLVESKGARLSCFSGNNSFGLSLDLLSKDLDQMLRLLADLITDSKFPQNEFKRQKKKNLALLKAQEDNIFESGTKLLKATLFEKHPYRFPVIGNERSLKKLKRRDLIKFYRNFCVGKNMVLAVFGDVDTQQVLLKVKKLFAKLRPGDVPCIVPAEEPKTKTMRISSKLLSKKQSVVLMGFLGTTVFSQDRYVLEVICHILSQASGRLFTQIREKTGLAYTLGAYQVLGLDPGYLVVYVATTVENVETVKKEILRQLRLLKQKPLNEEELVRVKRAILSKRLISRQTNSACALESSLDELYGLGYNHYLEYTDKINCVVADDITRCANQYFDLNNYGLVVIGPGNIKEEQGSK